MKINEIRRLVDALGKPAQQSRRPNPRLREEKAPERSDVVSLDQQHRRRISDDVPNRRRTADEVHRERRRPASDLLSKRPPVDDVNREPRRLEDVQAERKEKVSDIKSRVRSGDYKVDSKQLATALLRDLF